MGLFDKKNFIKIEKDDLKDARLSSASFCDEETKKRAFVNVLGARLAMKMLFSKKVEANNVYSMYTIHNVLKELDIADIYYSGLKIDVRLVFNSNEVFIPKAHFQQGLLPDLYLVLELKSDMSGAEILGFFEPKNLNQDNANKDFYFIEQSELLSVDKIKKFLDGYAPAQKSSSTELELQKAEELFIAAVDSELSKSDKLYLFKQLNDNIELREKFVEFENFELISSKVARSQELIQDGILDIVGAQQLYEDEEVATSKEEFKAEVIEEVLSTMLEPGEIEVQEQDALSDEPDDDGDDFMNELRANSEPDSGRVESSDDDSTGNSASFATGAVAGVTAGVALGAAAAGAAMAAASTLSSQEAVIKGGADVLSSSIDAAAQVAKGGIKIVSDLSESKNAAEEIFADFDEVEVVEDDLFANSDDVDAIEIEEDEIADSFDIEELSKTDDDSELLLDDLAEIDYMESSSDSEEIESLEDFEDFSVQEESGIEMDSVEEIADAESFEDAEQDEIFDEIQGILQEDELQIDETSENEQCDDEELSQENEDSISTEEEINFAELEDLIEEPILETDVDDSSELMELKDVFDGVGDSQENLDVQSEVIDDAIELNSMQISEIHELPQLHLEEFSQLEELKEYTEDEFGEQAAEALPVEEMKEEPTLKPESDSALDAEEIGFDSIETVEEFSPVPELVGGISELALGMDNVAPEYLKALQSQSEFSGSLGNEIQEIEMPAFEESDGSIEENAPKYDDIKSDAAQEKIENQGYFISEPEDIEEVPPELISTESSSDSDSVDSVISEVDSFLNSIDIGVNLNEIKDEGLSNFDLDFLDKNYSQNIESQDSESEVLSAKDSLQVLFDEKGLNNLAEEKDDLDFEQMFPTGKKIMDAVKKDKKVAIAASIAGVMLVSFVVGGVITATKGEGSKPQDMSAPATGQAPGELTSEMASPADPNQAMGDSGQMPMADASMDGQMPGQINKDMSEAVSDAFSSEPVNATITKVAWEVPEDLAYNDGFRRYLQITGKNLKINLQNDLLLASEMAYSNKVVVDLEIGKDGSLLSSNVVSTSGSRQIDKIVLQSVKNTLKYLKMPPDELTGDSANVTLIINF